MKTIQRYIEIPINELQTGKALEIDISASNCCCLCGKPIKDVSKAKMVHLLTNGNIVSWDGDDIAESQGFFPVGNECVKRLVIQFAF
jgi:hypothetical protein